MTRRGFLSLAGLLAAAVAPSDARPPRPPRRLGASGVENELPTPNSQLPTTAHDYIGAPIVHEHESPDQTNRFFDLSFRSDADDDGNAGVPHVGVITGKASALGEWLGNHDGQRVALSLRAGGRLTRDGEPR